MNSGFPGFRVFLGVLIFLVFGIFAAGVLMQFSIALWGYFKFSNLLFGYEDIRRAFNLSIVIGPFLTVGIWISALIDFYRKGSEK